MMRIETDRNNNLDNLKFILMYFVVLQHTLYFLNGWGYYTSGFPQQNYLGEYLRCIQMPAFMLISGFFFRKSVLKYPKFNDLILKNILTNMVVPMVFWGIVAYLIENIGKYSWDTFFVYQWNKFWFFKVLILLKLVFSLDKYVMKNKAIIIILFISLFFFPTFSDNNFIQFSAMFPFFGVGYWISESKYENILVKYELSLIQIMLCGILWIIVFVIAKNTCGVYDISISWQYMNVFGMLTVAFSIMLKVSGIYLLYNSIKKIPNGKINNWGGNTIAVYPLHCIIVDALANNNVFEYVSYQYPIYVVVRSIILAGIIFVFCNYLVECISCNKILRGVCLGRFR